MFHFLVDLFQLSRPLTRAEVLLVNVQTENWKRSGMDDRMGGDLSVPAVAATVPADL